MTETISTLLQPPHNMEAEHAVIGGVLFNGVSAARIMLKSSAFYRREHRLIWDAVTDLQKAGEPIDVMTVADQLQTSGRLAEAGGIDYLSHIASSIYSTANIEHYAQIIQEHAQRRALISAAHGIADRGFNPQGRSIAELVSEAARQIAAIETSSSDDAPDMDTAIQEVIADLERRAANKGKITGLSTGFRDIDKKLQGLQKGEVWVIGGRPAMGKAQPLHSKILLSNGQFVEMGSISLGDKLASPDGAASEVVGIYPQGMRPVFEVSLSDGRTVEADIEHLWQISSSKFTGSRVVTTHELSEMLLKERFRKRITLAHHSGEFGAENDLGIDPWLLGFLLGDGGLSNRSIRYSASEDYIIGRVEMVSPIQPKKCPGDNVDWSLTTPKGSPNALLSALDSLGLMGKRSEEKFIPDVVFTSSRSIREKVLAGLLESDGWVEKANAVCFSSASEKLAMGVVRLVHSLGGKAKSTVKKSPKFTYKGEKRVGLDAHVVCLAIPDIERFINSPRLLKNLKPRTKTTQPVVESVRYVGDKECQCIMVSHPSHLYLTDNYVVTHNTAFALNICAHAALSGEPVLVFSLEMPRAALMRRVFAALGGVANEKLKSGDLSPEEWDRINSAANKLKGKPLYIDDTPERTSAQIRAAVRRFTAKHGRPPALVVIDYLQLMTDEGGDSRQGQISTMSRNVKLMAREHDTPVILLSQLNRSLEQRADKRPLMSDLRESGSIEQDADMVAMLYREKAYNPGAQEDTLEVIFRKMREGETGTVYLRSALWVSRFENHATVNQVRSYTESLRGLD